MTSFTAKEVASKSHLDSRPVLQARLEEAAEEKVKVLSQKLVDISADLAAKDEQFKQQALIAKGAIEDLISMDEQLKEHTIILKEAVAGRKRAEDDFRTLKQEFEVVCQQKSAGEARLHQLDGALKECMKEARNVSDGQAQKMNETILFMEKEWDEVRTELETENAQLRRQLLESSAEKSAMSRSMQERAKSIEEIYEFKSKAESEVKVLQVQMESKEKHINAFEYEIHVLKKELQIRNEEKDVSKRAADVAHKQHLESVKKIAKLDSECQRLRALIRKKLPGPAAIAQMKMEVDNMGKMETAEGRKKKSSKEVEALTERLMSMEDETKLLKEVLAKRTVELQAARQLCARTATKLSSAESLLEALARGQNVASDHAKDVIAGMESMEVMDLAASSEEGCNDDEVSCAESWASALIVELSHLRNEDGASSLNHPQKQLLLLAKPDNGRDEVAVIQIDPATTMASKVQALNAWFQTIDRKLSSVADRLHAIESNLKQEFVNSPSVLVDLSQIMYGFSELKHSVDEVRKAMENAELLQASNVKSIDASCKAINSVDEEQHEELLSGEEVVAEDMINSPTQLVNLKVVLSKVLEALILLAQHDQKVCESELGMGDENSLQRQAEGLIVIKDGKEAGDEGEEDDKSEAILCELVKVMRRHYGLDDDGKEECNADVQSKVVELATELERLQVELEKAKEDRMAAKEDRMAMETKLHDAQEDIQRINGQVLELEEQLKDMQNANAVLEKEISSISDVKHGLEAQLSSVKTELQQRNQELQGKLAAANNREFIQGRKSGDGDGDGNARKVWEVAAAKEQLAECQRTILELSNQLQSLTSAHEPSSPAATTVVKKKQQPSSAVVRAHGSFDGDGYKATSRRTNGGMLRTRGGRLISADQFWSSSSFVPATAMDPPFNPSTCLPSPLHEFGPDASPFHSYTPPDTALSSPAGSPARFEAQIEDKTGRKFGIGTHRVLATTNLVPASNTPGRSGTVPAPKPGKVPTGSRFVRFFARMKSQQ